MTCEKADLKVQQSSTVVQLFSKCPVENPANNQSEIL